MAKDTALVEATAGARLPPVLPEYNIFSCTIALAFSGIGAGILSLPWAMATWGLLGGTTVLAVTAVLSAVSSCVLLAARRHCPGVEDYADVIAQYWPHPVVVNLAIILDCFGALVVFADYGADAVIATAVAFGWPVPLSSLTKVVFCTIVASLAVPRSINHVGRLSPLCLTALGYICALVIFEALRAAVHANDSNGSDDLTIQLFTLSSSSLDGICAFFFAFVTQMNLFDVTSALADPTPQRKTRVVVMATLVMLGAYALVAACGYLAFGSAVQVDVLNNFPLQRFDVRLANLAMLGVLIVSSVLCFYPTRNSVLGLLGVQKEYAMQEWSTATVGIGVAISMVAIACPSIVKALDLLGGFCAPCIVFLFPALTLRVCEAPTQACVLYGATLIGFTALARAVLQTMNFTG